MHLFGQLCFFDGIAKSRAARVLAFMPSVIETARRRATTAFDTAIRRQLNRLPAARGAAPALPSTMPL
jgi:hypothetical protein